MRCLFLPDNLQSIMYEEQKLFQTELSFPFRKTIPFFKTERNYEVIKIYPPVAVDGFIVRPCNCGGEDLKNCGGNGKESGGIEGFVLGYAGEFAERLLEKIPALKTKKNLPLFSVLTCKSWYFADFSYTGNGACVSWKISNITWQKQGCAKNQTRC